MNQIISSTITELEADFRKISGVTKTQVALGVERETFAFDADGEEDNDPLHMFNATMKNGRTIAVQFIVPAEGISSKQITSLIDLAVEPQPGLVWSEDDLKGTETAARTSVIKQFSGRQSGQLLYYVTLTEHPRMAHLCLVEVGLIEHAKIFVEFNEAFHAIGRGPGVN